MPAPVGVTGDGAQGGNGGTAGAGHIEQYEYTPDGAASSVVNIGTKWVVDKEPGPGQPGQPGADGVVIIWWDREKAET